MNSVDAAVAYEHEYQGRRFAGRPAQIFFVHEGEYMHGTLAADSLKPNTAADGSSLFNGSYAALTEQRLRKAREESVKSTQSARLFATAAANEYVTGGKPLPGALEANHKALAALPDLRADIDESECDMEE